MHYNENDRHKLPHIHAQYGEYDSVFDLEGNELRGNFPNKQKKMVEAWIMIHQDELNTLWKLLRDNKEFFRIEPLK